MPSNTLRPDNYQEWNPRWFEKPDAKEDADFYVVPRRVVHIDEVAIACVTQLYRELLPANGKILDLMSSWRSHLPTDVDYGRVAGLGMNAAEMIDNPQLTAYKVHDLNANPTLPYADGEFDAACCCVSVQYLQKPVDVFRDVARVVKPGGVFIVTFSNRCFPTKAINLWRGTDDDMHMDIVTLYFQAAAAWRDITNQDRSAPCAQKHQCDPLWAVWGLRDS